MRVNISLYVLVKSIFNKMCACCAKKFWLLHVIMLGEHTNNLEHVSDCLYSSDEKMYPLIKLSKEIMHVQVESIQASTNVNT